MKGQWTVTSNHINGETLYGVYRLKDVNAVDHSGNREMYGGYLKDRTACECIAEELNERELGHEED